MPLFALLGTDAPGARELRPKHRPAHLAHLEPLDQAGKIAHAGPLLDAEGRPCGSLVVFEAEDLAHARAIVEEDPYRKAGIFERIELWETRRVFPTG